LIHVGEVVFKGCSGGLKEREKLLKRYLNAEGESVFFIHSLLHRVEDPEGKEKVRKEAYALSLNLLL
jgi:hypothetical protein